MWIVNAQIYTDDFHFHPGHLLVQDGRIEKVITDPAEPDTGGEDAVDLQGGYVIPGLVDIHFHGCMGADFCDGTREAIETLAAYECSVGVTAICPATLTLPVGELASILSCAAEYAADPSEGGADLIGINMEGPFISRARKGAQNEEHIIPCSTAVCEEFLRASHGLVKIVGLAPEMEGEYRPYIESMKDRVKISLAHTDADYETAADAIRAGISHAVHLFNGMPEMLHRRPGAAGAVLDSRHVTAELICDGNHLHDSMIRMAFRLLGDERTVLISDSLRLTGLGDGRMMLGGKQVQVTGTRAVLAEEGNLAGSVTHLADCLRIAVKKIGVPLESAVRSVTYNPARVIGEEGRYGLIRPGRKADLVLLEKDLSLKGVLKDGVRIK